MSELKTQEGEAVIGTCNICGRTVATEEDLPKQRKHGGQEAVIGS